MREQLKLNQVAAKVRAFLEYQNYTFYQVKFSLKKVNCC